MSALLVKGLALFVLYICGSLLVSATLGLFAFSIGYWFAIGWEEGKFKAISKNLSKVPMDFLSSIKKDEQREKDSI